MTRIPKRISVITWETNVRQVSLLDLIDLQLKQS